MAIYIVVRDYIVSYDRRNRVPHWVFEHLTKESVARNEAVDRAKSSFSEDESIHKFFRAQNSDYKVRPIKTNVGGCPVYYCCLFTVQWV